MFPSPIPAQDAHAVEPRPLSQPKGQVWHAIAPVWAPLYDPAAQSAHSLWPTLPWNVPTGHSTHSRCPASLLYMPAGQSVHVPAWPSLVRPVAPTLPAGQAVPEQDVAVLQPPPLYCPGGHAAHVLQ